MYYGSKNVYIVVWLWFVLTTVFNYGFIFKNYHWIVQVKMWIDICETHEPQFKFWLRAALWWFFNSNQIYNNLEHNFYFITYSSIYLFLDFTLLNSF